MSRRDLQLLGSTRESLSRNPLLIQVSAKSADMGQFDQSRSSAVSGGQSEEKMHESSCI